MRRRVVARSPNRLLVATLILAAVMACVIAHELETGKPVPDLTLLKMGEGKVAVADYRGQVLLLNFWATWCEPCKEEMPIFQSLLDAYGEAGLAVALVSMGDSPEDVADYVHAHSYTFDWLTDFEGVVERTYGINALPTTLLIDSEGVLQGRWVGSVGEDD